MSKLDISVSADGIDLDAFRQVEETQPDQRFRHGRSELRTTLNRARAISRGSAGIQSVDGRMYWSSVLFTRIIVMATSILNLVPHNERKDNWDAASICSLTRNLAECYLWMYFICFDRVADSEHEARILMMYAHDNRGRERIMEETRPNPDLAEYYRRVRYEISLRLVENEFFKTLPERKRNEVIKGDKTPFIQDDLLDRMGTDKKAFRAMYRLLSAQAHSSPVAFYDVLTLGGGSGTAHEQEMRYIGTALEFAVEIIGWGAADMLTMHPYAERRGRLISKSDVRNGRHLGFPIPDQP